MAYSCCFNISTNAFLIFPDLNKDGELEWKDFDLARQVQLFTNIFLMSFAGLSDIDIFIKHTGVLAFVYSITYRLA